MSEELKKAVWAQFATAAMQAAIQTKIADVPIFAALVADRLTDQWDARFGDAAFLVDGQKECGACHKPLPDGAEFVPSVDGVKFCNLACLKATGREE